MAQVERGKKYLTKDAAGLECLNCTLPVSVCCGSPERCMERYKKLLLKRNKPKNVRPTRRKAVMQISADSGETIKIYPSVTEAARVMHGRVGNIIACCRNRCRTSYGYIWKYKNTAKEGL